LRRSITDDAPRSIIRDLVADDKLRLIVDATDDGGSPSWQNEWLIRAPLAIALRQDKRLDHSAP